MHVLMSSMKNEGPYVLEFVAHHLVLGFDKLLIASNDCSDGTDDLLQALHEAGFIGHLSNVLAPGEVPQHAGYAKLRAHFGLNGVEWVMVLDADEFLHVSVGDGTVKALTAMTPDNVDVIALNALTFGTVLGADWEPGRVCAQFTQRLGARNKINGSIKSLTRHPHRFDEIHNHYLFGFRGTMPLHAMRADGSMFEVGAHAPIWKQLRMMPADKIRHSWAHYNHYAIKTYDSFAARRDRGRGSIADTTPDKQRHTDTYFVAHLNANIFDDKISVYSQRVMAKMTEMLTHPAVAGAHLAAQTRYARLLAPYRALALGPD